MSTKNGKQLALKRGSSTTVIQVADKWIVGLVKNHSRVQSNAEVLSERRLTDAYRTLDCDVAEVQYTLQYSSLRYQELCTL